MAGWEELLNLVLDEGRRLIDQADVKHPSLPIEVIADQWLAMRKPTGFYWDTIFTGFYEIESSAEVLKDIAIYVGSFPYRSSQASQVRCLKYHLQNYLQEVYILKERLRSWPRAIEKSLKGDERSGQLHSTCRRLHQFIELTFKPIIDIRSGHVHRCRFEPAAMKVLDECDLLRMGSGTNKIKRPSGGFDHACRVARRQCRQNMVSTNEKVAAALDVYADTVIPLLFDPSSRRLVYPARRARGHIRS